MTVSQIYVRHNMEVAHRLFLQPGKCQQIHGHSMNLTLILRGAVNDDGIFSGIDFSDLKKAFRGYIDETYDHHLLLNKADPYVSLNLKGTQAFDGDPTTENLSRWITQGTVFLLERRFDVSDISEVTIDISETNTNGARYSTTDLERR